MTDAGLDLNTINRLTSGKLGTFDVCCPLCSSHRSTPANRRKKVLRIWHIERDFATFCCVHCGEHGHVLDYNGKPPDPVKLQKARAAAAERARIHTAERLSLARWLWSQRLDPQGTIEGILDYRARVSSREAYVSPTRGAQGNALKTILAMPFALDGESGETVIEARGVLHRIVFSIDRIRREPKIMHTQEASPVKTGTRITVRWPDSACSNLDDAENRFLQIAVDFTWINPHLTLSVDWKRSTKHLKGLIAASNVGWSKWRPSDPTSPHWYGASHLERLMAAYIAYEQERNLAPRTVREFISEFRGLSGSAKQKAVLDAVAASRALLAGFFGSGDHVNTDAVVKLLAAMRERARPIKPKDLGIIGEDHLRARFETIGAALESFNYRKVEVEHDGLPYLIEFAFGYCPKSKNGRRIITGINWSASVGGNPFRNLSTAGESLDSILTEQRAGGNEPIVMVLHLVCPRVEHLDRGKTCIAIPGRIAATIVDLVRSGTKRWCDQRKAEERHERTKANRDDRLIHFKVHKATIKDVAYEVMRRAYMAASTNGTLPANARQIYYAARGEILERTGKDNLDSQYFCQTLLVDYVRETGVDWDIIWDDRGHFTEPHTKHMFGLGTLNVRKYLAKIGAPCFIRPSFGGGGVDTRGPDGRFGAVLFIEKEGFMPLFERVHLAERHDIAIMSTKGMSVTAARILVDKMCGRYKIPVYVLHDFDVSGFSIFGTLRGNTDRYTFNNAIKVVDLGLRLTDVEALGLQSEQVSLGNTDRHKIRRRLERNGATAAEVESLLTERRVELNAMTSRELVDFVERKLRENGVMKIVPDQKRLATAYRLFHRNERLQKVVDATIKASTEDDIAVPDDLAERVKGRLSDTSMSWDEVIARIATTAPLADDGLADIPIVVNVPTLEGEFERRYWNSPLFDEGEDELPAVLTIDGRTLTISEWAREANIHPRVLEARIRAGWHPDWILIPFPGMTYWEG